MTDLDQDKLGAFRMRMAETMNAGATVLMVSIGHQTGLFDTMADLPPATSERIATAAGLNERYVREWLGSLVAAGVVDYKSTADHYSLPAEHAAVLSRSAGPGNMARTMQFIPLLATVEDQIIDKFHNGGGVTYDQYDAFHRIMGEVSGALHDAGLVSHMLPLVPGLVEALHGGVTVADVGCGSGHAINVMAQAFPASTFVGYDFSDAAIETARLEAEALGLTNASFEVADAAAIEITEQYDYVTTFDAVHDQAHPRAMVKSVHRMLKTGGYWLCADICASSHVGENQDLPIGVFGYAVSCMHCMSVSLAYDGEGLGAMWGVHKAREIFSEAGFTQIDVETIPIDPSNNYYVCHKT